MLAFIEELEEFKNEILSLIYYIINDDALK